MTTADGFDLPHAASDARALPASLAILLHGGRALLLFEDAESSLPMSGHMVQNGRKSLWTAESWRIGVEELRAVAWSRRA